MISVVTDATKNGLRSMTDDELFAIPNRGLKATAKVMTTLRVEESTDANPRLKQDRGCLGTFVSHLVRSPHGQRMPADRRTAR